MIGTKIRQLRLTHGWTQVQLAKKSGLSPKQISRIENGRVEPSNTSIKKLSTALEVDLGRYITGIEVQGDSLEIQIVRQLVELVTK